MSLQPLLQTECGQSNALLRLAQHATSDQSLSQHHRSVPTTNNSDEFVEQYLNETCTIPQSFHMNDLANEMNNLEVNHQLIVPQNSTAFNTEKNDSLWAHQFSGQQYETTNTNHNKIWDEISKEERSLVQSWPVNNLQSSISKYDPNIEVNPMYSKFVTFMKSDEARDVNFTEEQSHNWSQEFLDTIKNDIREPNSEFWINLQDELKETLDTNADESIHKWVPDFESYYPNPYKEYKFSEENPMLNVANPLEMGKRLLSEGDIPGAVLCFEAAAKVQPDNVEVWLLLGRTQSENEQDPAAISALIRCLQIDPGNLEALMALAICYTNESYYCQAAKSLVLWLAKNPKYADLVPPDFELSNNVSSFIEPNDQKLVEDLFIKAAVRRPDDIDYEVQCGLGVLFNLSGDYNKAVDCFRAAISARPTDAKLWNRLGATLANGSKPEEAVEAYHRSLSLEPGFIRARYNVGIICINLQAYKEAAEHFLTALNQQARSKVPNENIGKAQMSDTIWSTLRMCVSLMNRSDLKQFVDGRNLDKLNESFAIN